MAGFHKAVVESVRVRLHSVLSSDESIHCCIGDVLLMW